MKNNELMHYGVLGMKWGHRKSHTISSSKKKNQSVIVKKSKEWINTYTESLA